jgi:UDP-glucuronate decarboxylase
MMYAYSGQSALDVRVARIFNTFGPRMHQNDGRVVSNFIIEALQGKDLTIYGSGKQTRSFLFIEDALDGVEALIRSNYRQAINIGSEEMISIEEFTNTKLSQCSYTMGLDWHSSYRRLRSRTNFC